jgi:protocatechuate 3,4-dioxygenase beta subunit
VAPQTIEVSFAFNGSNQAHTIFDSAAKELEDESGLLPTFHKQTTVLDEAVPVEVDLDQQLDGIEIRPVSGKLYHVSGKVFAPPPGIATVTLISDTGRIKSTTDGSGQFSFEGVAPGRYDLLAETVDHQWAGFRALVVDNDTESAGLSLNRMPQAQFAIDDDKGNQIPADKVKLMARRKDLDGPGETQILKIVKDAAPLTPGLWEMAIEPPPANYAKEFNGPLPREAERGRADGWNEVDVGASVQIRIRLSTHPASVHGRVTGSGQDPAPGAPVYLEAYDQDSHKRLTELRTATTNMRGEYHFAGLAPGVYRILSSFEFDRPDSQTMDAAGARTVSLAEDKRIAQDLELYVKQ